MVRSMSPVERARQEVSSRAEPARAVRDGSYTRDRLVRLVGWTLVLGQVVWDVRVLLYRDRGVLLEWYHQLDKKTQQRRNKLY